MNLLAKYGDFLVYCVFGAMATAVNMLSYELLYSLWGLANVPSVALSWFLAVTFAFFTNRYIVFRRRDGEVMRHSIPFELGSSSSPKGVSDPRDEYHGPACRALYVHPLR